MAGAKPEEMKAVRVRGRPEQVTALLNEAGFRVTPGTAEILADGRWEVAGYASDVGMGSLQRAGLDVYEIPPEEPQPFERAAARTAEPLSLIRIVATTDTLYSEPLPSGLDLLDHGGRVRDDGRVEVYAHGTAFAIEEMRGRGAEVTIIRGL